MPPTHIFIKMLVLATKCIKTKHAFQSYLRKLHCLLANKRSYVYIKYNVVINDDIGPRPRKHLKCQNIPSRVSSS